MFSKDVNPEKEKELILKAAEIIKNNKMDTVAMILLHTTKPLIYIGGQMGRFFISPFLFAFGDNIYQTGNRLLTTFEKRENIDKLIKLLEEDEDKIKDNDKGEEKNPLKNEPEKTEDPIKRGWRRFLPF